MLAAARGCLAARGRTPAQEHRDEPTQHTVGAFGDDFLRSITRTSIAAQDSAGDSRALQVELQAISPVITLQRHHHESYEAPGSTSPAQNGQNSEIELHEHAISGFSPLSNSGRFKLARTATTNRFRTKFESQCCFPTHHDSLKREQGTHCSVEFIFLSFSVITPTTKLYGIHVLQWPKYDHLKAQRRNDRAETSFREGAAQPQTRMTRKRTGIFRPTGAFEYRGGKDVRK